MSPQIHILKSQLPVPKNVTVFGNKFFKKMIKLKRGSYDGALIQCDQYPCKNKKRDQEFLGKEG